MKDTIIVNLFGRPGVGKTATAAGIFAEMKRRNISCELVTEFAKMAVWEGRDVATQNEIYMFAKKHQSLKVLEGKVDYIIIDSPLAMTAVYNPLYGQVMYLDRLAINQFNSFYNINILLRDTDEDSYESEGRIHNFQEAKEIERRLLDIFDKLDGVVLEEEPKKVEYTDLVDRILNIGFKREGMIR